MNHTPTPYNAIKDLPLRVTESDNGNHLFVATHNFKVLCEIENLETAAHIVKCVNSHEALVEILIQAKQWIEDTQKDFRLEDSGILEDIDKAIAAAEGGK